MGLEVEVHIAAQLVSSPHYRSSVLLFATQPCTDRTCSGAVGSSPQSQFLLKVFDHRADAVVR